MATNRFIPINLRLPRSLIAESDKLAELEGSSRSELVRNALRSYIERRRKLQAVYTLVERRGKEAGINSQGDIDRALAEISEADYIVSGDQDLLALCRHRNISIIKASDFLRLMELK